MDFPGKGKRARLCDGDASNFTAWRTAFRLCLLASKDRDFSVPSRHIMTREERTTGKQVVALHDGYTTFINKHLKLRNW